jgi:hypothetical protein
VACADIWQVLGQDCPAITVCPITVLCTVGWYLQLRGGRSAIWGPRQSIPNVSNDGKDCKESIQSGRCNRIELQSAKLIQPPTLNWGALPWRALIHLVVPLVFH